MTGGAPAISLGLLGNAVFVLAGGHDERTLHLRALSAIAQVAQNDRFMARWMDADGPEDLRRMILEADRRRF